jgi:zinc/manganese transport system substrate-binding protein
MKRHAFLALLGIGMLTACRPAPEPSSGDGRLLILTSFLPLQSHTAAIAGDLVIVEQLLTKDAGPHDFQFSPAESVTL